MMKINKKGFTTIELVGAMIIIAVLSIAGVTAVNKAVQNSRMTALREDLSGFVQPISQFIIENPEVFTKSTQPFNCAAELNEYLEGDMQFKQVPAKTLGADQLKFLRYWELKREDPWKTPYRIFITTVDHPATGYTNSPDQEIRIFVVSSGKNRRTQADNIFEIDGVDDAFVMIESINGEISSGFYGMRDGNSEFSPSGATINSLTSTVEDSSKFNGGTYKQIGHGREGSVCYLNCTVLSNNVTAVK